MSTPVSKDRTKTPIPIGPPATPDWIKVQSTTKVPEPEYVNLGASRGVLNRSSSDASERQQSIAALGTAVPVIYGQDIASAYISGVVITGNKLWLRVMWCMGECEAIVSVYMNGEEVPAGVHRYDRLGVIGQTVVSELAAAYAEVGITYTDTLSSSGWAVCYSVFSVPATVTDGFPEFTAVIKGRKVSTTFGGPKTYSTCPAYCLADFVENPFFGMGRVINWSDVAAVAAKNNESVGGEARRTINLSLINELFVEDWLTTLRTYAGCFVSDEGGSIRLVPDAVTSSEYSFTPTNIVAGSIQVTKTGPLDIPTVMRVKYTDTSTVPYKDGEAVVYASGVLAGTTPWRESVISLPGINRYSQADREGVERLNSLTLCDLIVSFSTFFAGVKMMVGMRVDVTHPIGLSSKSVRIATVNDAADGSYAITATEYDPAVYSDIVASEPTTPDSNLPNPSLPPQLAALTITEETYRTEIGTFASRIRVSWTDPGWPFVREYRIIISAASVEVHTGTAYDTATSYASPALQEGVAYTVGVAIVSSTRSVGAFRYGNITTVGKSINPGNVVTLSGFEAGGRVLLNWTAADNPTIPGTPDPDIWRYEIRYGTTAGSWDTATVLDQVDSLTFTCEIIAPGTWRFYVKAIDSVQQYSATAATRDIVVTLDSGAYTAQTKTFTTATLTSMTAWSVRPDQTQYWTTDFGDGIGYGADNTNNAIGTFNDSLASTVWPQPHTAGNSAWESEAWDVGSSVSGTWRATLNYTLHSGSAQVSILLSSNGSTWTTYPGTAVKASGRFAKVRLDITTGSATVAGYPTLSLSQTPRSESIASITTLAAGSGGKLVQLVNTYSVARSLQLTPLGSLFATAVADRLLVSAETGLMLSFTLSASGSVFQLFSNSTPLPRLIVSGDYIEFDVRAFPTNPNLSATFGVYATYTDASNSGHYSTVSAGVWTSIKTLLTVGKTINGVNFAASSTVAGDYAVQIRNVRITDGAGTTRATIWSSGEPPQNSTTSSSNAANIKMGPANSFMAYAFNSGGTQIPYDVSVKFEGS